MASDDLSSDQLVPKQPLTTPMATDETPTMIVPDDYESSDSSSSASEGDDDLSLEEPPSNERLLCTAFISFMTFSVCQTIAAVIAGSAAMMGDSAAMLVDALTYLFNLIAERKKKTFRLAQQQEQLRCTSNHPELAQKLRVLKYKRYILQLELIPPLLSVSTLLVVTGFVLHGAIQVLVLDAKRDASEQADPNIHIMMLFSVLNLLLDGLNVFCFAKAKHALGYNTKEEPDRPRTSRRRKPSAVKPLIDHDKLDSAIRLQPGADSSKSLTLDSLTPLEIEEFRSEADMDDDEQHANLNMCSAYTHVFADTLRSIAVIVAAAIAELVEIVTSEEADAAAAVVVSVLIILSLIPLFSGLVQTFSTLQKIRDEEQLLQTSDDGTTEYHDMT